MKLKITWLALYCATTSFTLAANDYIQGHIGALSNQFNADVGDVPGNRYNGNIEFDYHKNRPYQLESRFTFATLVNDQNLAMYSLQEAYIAKKINDNNSIKGGRQILPWSTVDSAWGFGKLNNRRNFNGFEPGQEGLAGLNYEIKQSGASGMRLQLFGSPIFIPEMNPSLDINKSDKTITSRNPWADAPASTADTGATGVKDIQYIVDYPSLNQVVWRFAAGANLAYESKHFVIDGFYIRKPENQISTKVEIKLNAADDVVKAYVTPQFYYHDVYGGNIKYRNADLEMYVSGIAIRPNDFPDGDEDVTRLTEIKTEKRREDYVGGGISKINDRFGMGANYVARLSPFDRLKDTLAIEPRWNQAVDIFVTRTFGRKFNVLADIKYDMMTTDRLVMIKAGYMVSRQMQVNFGVSMIGTPNDGKSFWSPYTNNDSIFGGLRYVF